MDSISGSELRSRMEPVLHELIREARYGIETVNALDLLTYNRFDIAAKLLFLDGLDVGAGFFDDVYLDHVRAFTLGSFKEPGDEHKESAEAFVRSFKGLYRGLQANGFREELSLVPLASDGSILNGAHRVASAIKLGLPLRCVRLTSTAAPYDAEFFRERAMPERFLDLSALRFVEAAPNCFLALMWPAAKGHLDELRRIIPRIVHYKEIPLTLDGFHNLLATVYSGEAWLGERSANYPGVRGKLAPCWADDHPLRLFVFQASGLEEVLGIKERIRAVFGMDKHSVHINDDKAEALTIARALLNENAVHFLNHARPNRFASTSAKIATFRQWAAGRGADADDLALDGGMVLSAYGIRESSDIDFLSLHDIEGAGADREISSHNHDALEFHGRSLAPLLRDPRCHFWFDGVKFVAFAQVLQMKSRRAEAKDRNDVASMRALIERNFFKSLLAGIRQRLLYARVRAFIWALGMLRSVGLYGVVRSIYHKVYK